MSGNDASYNVKNTFLEVPMPEDGEEPGETKRRTLSDVGAPAGSLNASSSPLVVAKSPAGSPHLGPVDETLQALPIDDVNFELLEESALADVTGSHFGAVGSAALGPGRSPDFGALPDSVAPTPGHPAYVMPTTPSPFLRSVAFPTHNVPHLDWGYSAAAAQDMGLPHSFDALQLAGAAQGMEGYAMQDMEAQYMQGMYYGDMFDHSTGQAIPPEMYMQYGWMGMDPNSAEAMAGMGADLSLEGMMSYAADSSMGGAQQQVQLEQGLTDIPAAVEAPSTVEAPVTKTKESRSRKKNERPPRDQDDRAAAEVVSSGRAGRTEEEGEGGMDSKDKPPPGAFTTVMLRNIPNKYTREMLISQLSLDFYGRFDFMYLPIDFKNKCNVGYGFINFRTEDACVKFVHDFNGVEVRKCLPGLNSKKVVEVTPARVQGLAENVRRLKNSPVMNQLVDHPEWMPLLFNERGEQEVFPQPDQPLPPVKPRRRAPEGSREN